MHISLNTNSGISLTRPAKARVICHCTFCINTGSVLNNGQFMNRRGESRSRNIGHVCLHLLKCSTHWILAWSVGHVMSSLAQRSAAGLREWVEHMIEHLPAALPYNTQSNIWWVERVWGGSLEHRASESSLLLALNLFAQLCIASLWSYRVGLIIQSGTVEIRCMICESDKCCRCLVE